MIDEVTLKKASRFYNLKSKLVNKNTALVVNGIDQWLIEYDKNTDRYMLFHKNKANNRTQKFKYHYQRDFLDIWYMFRYIKEHKRGYKRYRKMHRINELFKQIKEN